MIFKFRKGSESIATGYVIIGIIAVIILFLVLTGFWKKISFIIYLVELIGFQTAIPQGNGVVGLNLVSGNLEYYTGESFKKFSDERVAVLAGYEFNIADTKNGLSDFYFKTARRPEILIMEVNHWRYWMVNLGKAFDSFGIVAFTKKGYVGPTSESYLLDKRNNYDLMGFAKIDSLQSSLPLQKINEWSDSILQGNKCEKFLTLKVKQNGVEKDVTYTVRKVDGYLVIDLTKPAANLVEKWNDVNCFEFDNYVDVEEEYSKPTAYVQFIDLDLLNKVEDNRLNFIFDFSSNVWTWPDTRYKSFFINRVKYVLDDSTRNSFYAGLAEIIRLGGKDATSFVVGIGSPENLVVVKELSEEELKNVDKSVYEILDSYNKILIPKVIN